MRLLGQIILLAACGLFLQAFRCRAALKLPYLVADSMVLQQQTDIPVWGWAKPEATITITTSWNGKKSKTKTGSDGKWTAKVATPAAGGPYTMTISGDSSITLNNVLIGVGLKPLAWLSDPVLAVIAISVAIIWKTSSATPSSRR